LVPLTPEIVSPPDPESVKVPPGRVADPPVGFWTATMTSP
jgi:hypothetical protein